MKLAMIGPVYPFRGGISHFTSQLAKELLDFGHSVDIFSFRRQYPGWLYPGVSDKEVGTAPGHIEAQYLLDPIYPWTWTKTASMIKKNNPQAVLIHWWTTFWSPAYWSLAKILRRSGLEIVYIIHNVAPHEPLPWDSWLARNVLALGKAHIVQSKNEKQRLESLLPGSTPIIVPHPIYSQFKNDQQISKEEARHQLGLNIQDPMILFFGIVRSYKGLKYAIQAISILKNEGIPARLLVAGEFWEKIEEYEQQIIELGLTDHVLLYNRYIPNEDVQLFFSAVDIFIAPYVGGTQSGSIKIAMSFNLPIVATDRISDEIMLNSELVHIVPGENSEALVKEIKELIFQESQIVTSLPLPDTSWEDFIDTIEKLVDKKLDI